MLSRSIIYFSQLLPFSLLLVLLSACSYKSDHNDPAIKQLEESLLNSTRVINTGTDQILKSLEKKTSEPGTQDRAEIWFDKAKRIKTISSEAYNNIEELKKWGTPDSEKSKALYSLLLKYKDDILQMDVRIRDNLISSLNILSTPTSDSLVSQKDFNNNLFKKSNQVLKAVMYTKFQNDIKIIENNTINYCFHQVGETDGAGFFDSYSLIIGQNSKFFHPGDNIDITAGIGAYSKNSQPKITINGSPIELKEEGYAFYRFKVPQKPGKYSIPIQVNFFNQLYGKYEIHEKNIEYTVTKPCNQ